MSVRFFLTLRIDAGAGVLYEAGGRPQPAVRAEWKRRHAATSVVCKEQILPGAIDNEVARPRSARRLLVEQSEPAVCLDSERRYLSCSSTVLFHSPRREIFCSGARPENSAVRFHRLRLVRTTSQKSDQAGLDKSLCSWAPCRCQNRRQSHYSQEAQQ